MWIKTEDPRIEVRRVRGLGWRYRIARGEVYIEDGHYIDRRAAVEAGTMAIETYAANERRDVERNGR